MTAGESPIARRSTNPRAGPDGHPGRRIPIRGCEKIAPFQETIASAAKRSNPSTDVCRWDRFNQAAPLDRVASLAMTKVRPNSGPQPPAFAQPTRSSRALFNAAALSAFALASSSASV